ncbi:MAG TPA: hypothetical protein VMZ91_05085 [Candidatus Paceibacterota bacterium]|nr:hypothetical protein [Candidatus Paceibacterota bacterium]
MKNSYGFTTKELIDRLILIGKMGGYTIGIKKPSLKIYQNYARVYLDEYPEQKEERKEFFAKRWNLQNEALKRIA